MKIGKWSSFSIKDKISREKKNKKINKRLCSYLKSLEVYTHIESIEQPQGEIKENIKEQNKQEKHPLSPLLLFKLSSSSRNSANTIAASQLLRVSASRSPEPGLMKAEYTVRPFSTG